LRRGRFDSAQRPDTERSRSDRGNEILFIDARNEGHLINRRTKELSAEDIQKITETYHAWRASKPGTSTPLGVRKIKTRSLSGAETSTYQDIKGFCASAPIERVRELDYVLTPGRYVGLPDDEDDFDFKERFTSLKKEFEGQLKEEAKLNEMIKVNLRKVKLV
jgi:type I restriction enzyme M protein